MQLWRLHAQVEGHLLDRSQRRSSAGQHPRAPAAEPGTARLSSRAHNGASDREAMQFGQPGNATRFAVASVSLDRLTSGQPEGDLRRERQQCHPHGHQTQWAQVHGRSNFGQIFEHCTNMPAFDVSPPPDDDLSRLVRLQKSVAFDVSMATVLCDRQSVDSARHRAVTLKRSFVQQRILLGGALAVGPGPQSFHDTF